MHQAQLPPRARHVPAGARARAAAQLRRVGGGPHRPPGIPDPLPPQHVRRALLLPPATRHAGRPPPTTITK
eukprot:9476655-Pyramimonas_sp.AAC.1